MRERPTAPARSMSSGIRARLRNGVAALLVATSLAGVAWPASGQLTDRSAIVRILEGSADFRARARAALALGASADPAMADPLARALRDENAAVRAAAADGLGRVGVRAHVSALRALARDPAREVREAAQRAIASIESRPSTSAATTTPATTARPGSPGSPLTTPPIAAAAAPRVTAEAAIPTIDWGRTQTVVVLGAMENRSDFAHPPLATVLRNEVVRTLTGVRGVGILRDAPDADVEREIARRHIRRFRLEGSIRTVRPEPGRDVRVRCEVTLLLLDDPGHNVRASLAGSATGTEPAGSPSGRSQQERRLAEQALQGAAHSAMGGAARALQGSGGGR